MQSTKDMVEVYLLLIEFTDTVEKVFNGGKMGESTKILVLGAGCSRLSVVEIEEIKTRLKKEHGEDVEIITESERKKRALVQELPNFMEVMMITAPSCSPADLINSIYIKTIDPVSAQDFHQTKDGQYKKRCKPREKKYVRRRRTNF
ncbi:hypothetical protein ACFL1Y_00980 [Patescibacteria group bacterium]